MRATERDGCHARDEEQNSRAPHGIPPSFIAQHQIVGICIGFAREQDGPGAVRGPQIGMGWTWNSDAQSAAAVSGHAPPSVSHGDGWTSLQPPSPQMP